MAEHGSDVWSAVSATSEVSSWWTHAVGWKITCFCLAASVAMLGGGLYRATSAHGITEAQGKRLAAQLLFQAQLTRELGLTVTAQNKTIDALTDSELDISRISVGLLKHAQETSPIPVRIAVPSRSGNTRQLASVKKPVAGWTDRLAEGGFLWPVRGTISSSFGPRGGGFHPGLDIAAPYGTPIRAAAAGRVTTASYSGGYGNLVVIEHPGAYATAYGHQSRIAVYVGEIVEQGQVIGYVGSTGNSTGNHLHFEVRINGKVTNPIDTLSTTR